MFIVNSLAKNWWAFALRGFAAVVFGILTMVWPQITLAVLVMFFGAYALVDGAFAIASAFVRSGPNNARPWWFSLLHGIVGIGIGIITFTWPGMTALGLLYYIAAWAFITGTLEIAAAISLRHEIRGEWMLVLSGVLSIVFGAILIARPLSGALAVAWLIGGYALLFGGLTMALGFRLKRFSGKVSRQPLPGPI